MMSDVDTVCAQIKRYEEEEPLKGGGPRIDMLYMSQAFSPLAPSGREFSSTFYYQMGNWSIVA